MRLLDIILGVAAQRAEAYEKEEGEEAGDEGREESKRTHGYAGGGRK